MATLSSAQVAIADSSSSARTSGLRPIKSAVEVTLFSFPFSSIQPSCESTHQSPFIPSHHGLDLLNSWASLPLVWPPPPPSLGSSSNLLRLESLLPTETGLKGRGKLGSQRRPRCTGKIHLNWGEVEARSPEPFPGSTLGGGRLRRAGSKGEPM